MILDRAKQSVYPLAAGVQCLISFAAILFLRSWQSIWIVSACQVLSIIILSGRLRTGIYSFISILAFTGPLLLMHGVINPQFPAVFHAFGFLPVRPDGLIHAAKLGGRLSFVSNAGIVVSQVPLLMLTKSLLRLRCPTKMVFAIIMAISLVKEMKRRVMIIAIAQLARGVPIYGGLIQRLRALSSLVIPLVVSSLVSSQRRADCLKSRGLEFAFETKGNYRKSATCCRIETIHVKSKETVTINEGDFVIWLSGVDTGKSLLARAIALPIDHEVAIEYSTTGNAEINEMVLTRDIGWIPTDTRHLFSGFAETVEEEISLTVQQYGNVTENSSEVATILKSFGLEELRQQDPFTLSGGECFRLALALSFAKGSRFHIIDESLEFVDEEQKDQLSRTLIYQASSRKAALLLFTNKSPILLPTRSKIHRFNNRNHNLEQKNTNIDKLRLSANTVLVAENLSFSYASGFQINDVNLTLNVGEIVRLRGLNGTGKTTLLKCLALLVNSTGHIKAINLETGELDEIKSKRKRHMWSHRVGYVFQNPADQLFCASVKNEIGFNVINDRFVTTVINVLGLYPYLQNNPLDLPLPMQRLIALATVFAKRPPVILLDEPTAFLDDRLANIVVEAIRKYRDAGHAFIIVSHDERINSLRTDQNLCMLEGRIVPI